MAALKGIDTGQSMTRHAQAVRAQGFDFVIRYYSHNTAKNLDAAEARALAAAGLRLGVIWESAGFQASYFSRAKGQLDAAAAAALARVVGQPSGSSIYFAVDYDPTQAEVEGPVADYFTGVAAALGGGYRIGVYGSGLCCGYLRDHALAACSWLSQSSGFAGSKAFAQAQRYDLLQALPTHILLDGASVEVDPDTSNPNGDPGLFQPA